MTQPGPQGLPNPNPEELALARKIVADTYPENVRGFSSLREQILWGLHDEGTNVQAALSAIQQTTELSVELAEVFTGHSSEALIAEALRRGDHLKQEAV